MAVRVRFVEVEGEPEEVMRLSALFGGSSEKVRREEHVPNASEPTETSVANVRSVTPELVLRVLTRRELRANIKKALKALQRSPKGMTSEELAKAVGIDRGQLAGVFGAFGRRVAHTKGWPADAAIISERRDENGRRVYHLAPVVLTALEKGNLLG